MLAEIIRRAMQQQNPYLRLVSLSSLSQDNTSATDGTPIKVTIDAQQMGTTALVVRSDSFDDTQSDLLKKRGFEELEDTDNMRMMIYVRVMENEPSINDLVTFVDWAFISVAGASPDYTPEIERPGAAKNNKSCASTAAIMALALALFVSIAAIL